MLQNIELCYFCSFMFFRSILTIHICLCSKELRYISPKFQRYVGSVPQICGPLWSHLFLFHRSLVPLGSVPQICGVSVVPLISVPQIFGLTCLSCFCSTDLWSHLFLFHRYVVPLASVPQNYGPFPQICGFSCLYSFAER